ncbi:MAG: hypothetical protein HKO65_03035 [Gemmatimonadetes bacterium]|nr:hypothetical protein [Gemmatimonadota bacterium]NNM04053.1 hypothetical protein [Gemmatimonadota bacterium]
MRRLTMALATVTFLVAFPSQAWGQFQVGPYLAYHDDADLGIGAFVGVPLPEIDENLSVVADFGFFFPGDHGSEGSDWDYWELNGDAIYRFPLENVGFTPWALGGINIARWSHDRGSEGPGDDHSGDTDIGINLGGGVTFGEGPVAPFAGVKFELSGGDGAVIFGGLSFTVGEGSQ